MRMLKCWLKGHWKGVEVFLMTIDNLISCLSNMQQHEKPSKQIEKVISEGSKVITSAPWWKHFLIWTINFSIVLRLVFALPCFICVRSLTSENLCLFPSSERGWSRQPKSRRWCLALIICNVTTQKPSLAHICDGEAWGKEHWLIFARPGKNEITCAMVIYNDFSTCKIALKWCTRRAI